MMWKAVLHGRKQQKKKATATIMPIKLRLMTVPGMVEQLAGAVYTGLRVRRD
jgi:hypothetical protein